MTHHMGGSCLPSRRAASRFITLWSVLESWQESERKPESSLFSSPFTIYSTLMLFLFKWQSGTILELEKQSVQLIKVACLSMQITPAWMNDWKCNENRHKCFSPWHTSRYNQTPALQRACSVSHWHQRATSDSKYVIMNPLLFCNEISCRLGETKNKSDRMEKKGSLRWANKWSSHRGRKASIRRPHQQTAQ